MALGGIRQASLGQGFFQYRRPFPTRLRLLGVDQKGVCAAPRAGGREMFLAILGQRIREG